MSLAKKILEDLSTPFVEGKLTIGGVVYRPYKLLYGDLKLAKQNSVYRALGRAEKRGYVKKRIVDEKTYIALTKLGRDKLKKIKDKPDFDTKVEDKEWDGKYRLVFFDIPEKNRAVRDLLRSKLKELGFVGWQKSVWVGREDVTAKLRGFFEEAGLRDYALVIETEDLGSKKLEYFLMSK
jgi:phenylacetic acid degradation operon negative regulatory protein